MGDATIINFSTREDQIQRTRFQLDSNKDGQIDAGEIAGNNLTIARGAIKDYKLPGSAGAAGTTGATGTTGAPITDNSTAPDVASAFNTGVGLVSNRPITASPTAASGATGASEINIGDASNSQRLRAAGLTEAQLYNPNNIFVHLGQNKDGHDQYGFYSKGFGEGDERAGVVTVGPDGKISSSLGAGWSAADLTKQAELKAAFDARAKLVNDKFNGKFEDYKKFETARAQVDDLLARGDVTVDARNNLTSLKTDMAKTSETGFNASALQERANVLLNTQSTTLQQIRQAEAAGKVADDANTGTEADLNTALRTQTNEVNTVTAEQKTAYTTELGAYNNKLKDLQGSNDPKIKAFLNAQKHLESKTNNPDKTTLAELKWQNARFDRMIKDDQAFKTAVEAARTSETTPTPTTSTSTTPTTTTSTTPTTPSSNSSTSNESIEAKKMATELGFADRLEQNSFLEQLRVIDANVDQYSSRGITISTPSDTKFNEVLISQGNKHFLYDRDSRTARSLTPVTGSQDAFYDASEPSTLLLKNLDKTFIKDVKSQNAFTYGAIGFAYHSDEKSQNAFTYGAIGPLSEYIFKEGKWQLISQ